MTAEALDPGLAGYLTTNRDFVDAAVAQAVAALGLPAGGRVLDMGTGAGGAIPHLVWPGNFADPAAIVARMAQAVKPGGVVALFYSNYYRSMFLPGHSRLERLLFAASEMRWQLPDSGPHHYERHLAWLLAAGLEDVTLRVFPGSAFPSTRTPPSAPIWSRRSGRSCASPPPYAGRGRG